MVKEKEKNCLFPNGIVNSARSTTIRVPVGESVRQFVFFGFFFCLLPILTRSPAAFAARAQESIFVA